jgi:hypothetical protein
MKADEALCPGATPVGRRSAQKLPNTCGESLLWSLYKIGILGLGFDIHS